jgi:hypothetical protein
MFLYYKIGGGKGRSIVVLRLGNMLLHSIATLALSGYKALCKKSETHKPAHSTALLSHSSKY